MRPLGPLLKWKRGRFAVMTQEIGQPPELAEVEGILAPPFGIYRGDGRGQDLLGSGRHFTLALLASHLQVAMFSQQIECKRLALELAALQVRWDAPSLEEIRGEGLTRAKEIIRRFVGTR